MAPQRSAGLLLYRRVDGGVEVLIGHMGGPFWAKKVEAAWSIPKGLAEPGEEDEQVAEREFAEEMGSPPPPGPGLALGEFRMSSGKRVIVFAREGDLDADAATSNTFEMEWPKGSGKTAEFPEIDRAAWVSPERARELLVKGQVPAIDALVEALTS